MMKPVFHLGVVVGALVSALVGWGCSQSRYDYPEPAIQVQALKDTVAFLSNMDPPRNYINTDALAQAADYIAQQLSSHGLQTKRQTFMVSDTEYENVVASVGPAGGPRIIVGAHYDSYGDQPGADDNASGVAGLLEIARALKEHQHKLRFRVDLVAYALEEPPFFATKHMGSYGHAKSLHDNQVDVRAMISLEMIGFFNSGEGSQDYPLDIMKYMYPDKGDFIGVVGNFASLSLVRHVARHMKKTAIPVEMLSAPASVHGVDFSDHRNYWTFGYDAVMVTDTAFYRNANYHQHSDTMDTLDYAKMAEVVKGICWAILNMS